MIAVVANYPLQGLLNGRVHRCVGSRIYSIFPCDSSLGAPSDTGEEVNTCSSNSESDSDTETIATAVSTIVPFHGNENSISGAACKPCNASKH